MTITFAQRILQEFYNHAGSQEVFDVLKQYHRQISAMLPGETAILLHLDEDFSYASQCIAVKQFIVFPPWSDPTTQDRLRQSQCLFDQRQDWYRQHQSNTTDETLHIIAMTAWSYGHAYAQLTQLRSKPRLIQRLFYKRLNKLTYHCVSWVYLLQYALMVENHDTPPTISILTNKNRMLKLQSLTDHLKGC